ncbi:MAG: polysaccharide deacetylase family protein [Candidatus Korobacteraceae bacterium]|jgi:peptidoglycan/xylan/chitin deacetylase (PgdA/CDA1 family)
MSLLKSIRRAFLATAGVGSFRIVERSNWRRQRLLILCYHGIAMGEEHASHPEMFLPPSTFAARMEILAQSGCKVLELGEALQLLQRGLLPAGSVAITFDDGWADFPINAFPILQKHRFPATVYLTTYYCLFNRPLFRFALAHMMWKVRTKVVENRTFPWLPPELDFGTQQSRSALMWQIDSYAKQQDFSGKQKDEIVAEFASAIGFDYPSFCRERLFQLMNPGEVTAMARAGIDFQLHTHRHRTPLDHDRFIDEIRQNRELVEELAGPGSHVHFCYPSGANRPEFIPWLQEAGVQSATTCENGLATSTGNAFLLPRLLDQYGLIDAEFESWLSGLAALLPRRRSLSLDVAPE